MFGQPFAQVRPWRDAGDPHLAHVSLHPLAIDRCEALLHQRAPLGMTQDGSFFFRKLTWVVRRPISAYRSSSWRSYVALTSVNESRRSNTSGRPLMAACFQSRRTVACTPYSDVSWLSVLVSFSSSRTTWALKVAV